MACFILARRSSARTLDVAAYPGLVAAHAAVDGTTSKLVSYWTAREDYDRYGKELYETVGATACVAEYYVTHYREPHVPLWKRIPWYTTLVTILAVVGAVSSFRSEIRNLTLTPEVVLSTRPGALNYLVGDPIDEPLTVTNRRPVTERITVTRTEVLSNGTATPYSVTFSPAAFALPENQTESVHFKAAVPSPGRYELRGSLEVHGGRFTEVAAPPFSIPFRVWSAGPTLEEPKLKIVRRANTKSELQGTLLLGTAAANGVVCIVRIHRHPELARVFTTFPGNATLERWKVEGPAGAEVGRAKFLLPRVAPMKPHTFRLELISTAETDWDDVVKEMEVEFSLHSTERLPCDDSSSF